MLHGLPQRQRLRGWGLLAAGAALLLLEGPAWLPGAPVLLAGTSASGDLAADEPLPRLPVAADWRPGRRAACGCAAALLSAALAWGAGAGVALAVVKGNAPPKTYGIGKNMSKAAECTTVGECQEIGRQREAEEYGRAEDIKYEKTSGGVRYKDLVVGSRESGVAKPGSVVRLRYRVMRSGKRSSDGLSGEASTIFSLGYGEDDGPKDAVLAAPIGEGRFVKALEEGLVGMAVGGTRRIQVRPEDGLGWKRAGKCAEEMQAVGLVAGLPMGGAENQETCIDDTKIPKPMDFASKRRFSRRFDESLIVEAELMGLGAN